MSTSRTLKRLCGCAMTINEFRARGQSCFTGSVEHCRECAQLQAQGKTETVRWVEERIEQAQKGHSVMHGHSTERRECGCMDTLFRSRRSAADAVAVASFTERCEECAIKLAMKDGWWWRQRLPWRRLCGSADRSCPSSCCRTGSD